MFFNSEDDLQFNLHNPHRGRGLDLENSKVKGGPPKKTVI